MSITSVNNAQLLLIQMFEILDRIEESDGGKLFRPTNIISCRAIDGHKLATLLMKARKEVGLGPLSEIRENEVQPLNEQSGRHSLEFCRGVKAINDYIVDCAANNYHGSPAQNAKGNEQNEVAFRWVEQALKNVCKEVYEEWISIDEAYKRGLAQGKSHASYETITRMNNRSFWEKIKDAFGFQ